MHIVNKTYKILVLEDDPASVLLVEKTLGRYNFQIDVAQNGVEGLVRVKKKKYDLIISDIMMPGMDGLEFVEKGSNYTAGTPIIMLTAAGDKNRVLRAAQSHVAHYLLKPIRPRDLMEKVLGTLKLELGSLVDIKLLPFKLVFKVDTENVLRIQWIGCPEKFSEEYVVKEMADAVKNYPKVKSFVFELGASLAYFGDALRLIENAVTTILMKNSSFSCSDITLKGEFLKEVSADEFKPYKFLSKCNLNN